MKPVVSRFLRRCVIGVFALLMSSWPASALEIQDVTSTSGVTAWHAQVPEIPLIAIELAFEAGAATEPMDQAGLRLILADMLLEGAGDLESQAFQSQMERLGIRIQSAPQRDHFRIGMTTPSIHAEKAFELLNMALTRLTVAPKDLERVVAQNTAALNRALKRPHHVASTAIMATLYPDHPYGQPSSGTLDGFASITARDVRDYARAHLTASGLFVSMVGDLDEEAAQKYLDILLQDVPAEAPRTTTKPVTARTVEDIRVIDIPVTQASISFAAPAVTRDHPDWLPLVLVARTVGGRGLSSRLFTEVRRKRGLAYSVGLSPINFLSSGLVLGSTGTANDTVWQAIDVIRMVFDDIAQNGLSATELDDAKSNLIGSLPLSLDTNEALANMLLHMQVYDMGRDYLDRRAALISAVTMEDIKRVSATYFHPDALTFIVAGAPDPQP